MLVIIRTSSFSYGGFITHQVQRVDAGMWHHLSLIPKTPLNYAEIKKIFEMNANKRHAYHINILKNLVLTVVSFSNQIIKFKHN